MKKVSLLEAGFALHIGNKILEEVGPVEPLKGDYLEVYNKYTSKMDEDIVYLKKEWNDDSESQMDSIDELNTEKLNIECFCRWLQEESKLTLHKEEKEE